jgi:phage gp36-like protein
MALPWVTQTQLEHRIGAAQVRRIYDDNRDGVADTNPVEALLLDACSFVAGGLGPHYSEETLATMATVPREITRITLDVAEAYAAKRHPTIVKRDWGKLMEEARLDIKQVRTGKANLGTTAVPEPSKLTAGDVYVNGEPDPDDYPETFSKDGFGGF